jgi:hypothetical protein
MTEQQTFAELVNAATKIYKYEFSRDCHSGNRDDSQVDSGDVKKTVASRTTDHDLKEGTSRSQVD